MVDQQKIPAFRHSRYRNSKLLWWMRGLWVTRLRQRKRWESAWSRTDSTMLFQADLPPEITSAVEDEWFLPGSSVLDIGCGDGDIAHWLSQRGLSVVGVDVAEAAINRARVKHGQVPGKLEFHAIDVTVQMPVGPFSAIVDRGCFHIIPPQRVPAYMSNITNVSSRNARMLLFHKLGGRDRNDLAVQKVRERVAQAFAGVFSIERVTDTFLDRCAGQQHDIALPALVFWMKRQGS